MNRALYQTKPRPEHCGELFLGDDSLFFEPRCCSWATVGTIATVAAAAVSISATAYAATNTPNIPSAASSSRQVAEAQANALPYQRGLSAAEQTGGQALRYGYTQSTVSADQRTQLQNQISRIQQQIAQAQTQQGNAGPSRTDRAGNPLPETTSTQNTARLQNRLSDLQAQLQAVPEGGGTVYRDSKGRVVPQSQAMADFSGYGTADIEGQLSRQMADIQTSLGAKYGVPFAEQARAEAEQADPMGFAARDKELQMIQQGIDNPLPINPLASTLDQTMAARVNAGSGLDQMSKDALDAAVAKAVAARGGSGPSASDVEQSASTGIEGAQRRQANIQQGQAWIQSGATPEDVEYRREQQNLSNLGQFVAGQTPESQFASLSGAGQGATPFVPGQQLPQQPGNAASIGVPYGVAAWQATLRQPNSWLAGISTALGGLGSAVRASGSTG